MKRKKRDLFYIVSASLVISAILVGSIAAMSDKTLVGSIAVDPNAEQESFRHIQKNTFGKNRRAALRAKRGYTDHLTNAPTPYEKDDIPRFKYRGNNETVENSSEIEIPDQCKKLSAARFARCMGIFTKEGIIYNPYKTRTAHYVPQKKRGSERERVSITYRTRGPEADQKEEVRHGSAPERYVPTLDSIMRPN